MVQRNIPLAARSGPVNQNDGHPGRNSLASPEGTGNIAMPYRFAHWLILMLIVLTVPAFWRSYLSDLSSSRIELHVHGVTASIWMALLAIQSWSIHNRHRRLHRALGVVFCFVRRVEVDVRFAVPLSSEVQHLG